MPAGKWTLRSNIRAIMKDHLSIAVYHLMKMMASLSYVPHLSIFPAQLPSHHLSVAVSITMI